jgi:hypothetical protein
MSTLIASKSTRRLYTCHRGSVEFRPGMFSDKSCLDDLDSFAADGTKIGILAEKRCIVIQACMDRPLLRRRVVLLIAFDTNIESWAGTRG